MVTATKQKDPIDKVPISIMALTQDQMDREGFRSVDDIARQAPGVEFSRSSYGGGMGSNIAIRFITPAPGLATYSGYARAEAVGGLS